MQKCAVLVAGGAGYIGAHTCKALARAGYTPVVIDNLVYGHEDFVRWGPLERGDIRDAAFLDRVLETWRPRYAMHFAGFTYVGESVSDPARYYGNNVTGSLCLLDALSRHGVEGVIFSSSCAVYGLPECLPLSEDAPKAPINPYGRTKLVVEEALADYGRAYGLKWVALRYFNAAGSSPEGEIGESHDPETHAIPLAIQAALGLGPGFRIFGTDYPTPDGTAIRDYVHVCDLADAHLRAMDYLCAGGSSGAFNLSTGRGVSVLELLNAVEKATGHPVPVTPGPRREGDPAALYAMAEKARTVLGWQPRYLDIVDMVATAVPWFAKDREPEAIRHTGQARR
ncbi:UDP-glucose 4-epimerase GalE [Phaeovibrio sulfidiphilus]|uniref:UDP-glucose 4-epimerase n=1 Tax=Phaeovibrio sulfidiphilus TaxID=1220600 RepID=A0A8J6YKR3_9PROT|nr:UDP-glucose 4-epimerase GalE [Phaeovibrio sulfidiphilus]MBE1236238.1 UDP-glucose 4-epimerase GalE [Phaeovibrio sulfidiphilus]